MKKSADKRWSPEEKEILRKRMKEGRSYREIAYELGRSVPSVAEAARRDRASGGDGIMDETRSRCLMGGCQTPRHCIRCGFWPSEAERRQALPLQAGTDGLRRMVISGSKVRRYEQMPGLSL